MTGSNLERIETIVGKRENDDLLLLKCFQKLFRSLSTTRLFDKGLILHYDEVSKL